MLLLADFNLAAACSFLDPFRAANYIRGQNLYQWNFVSCADDVVNASNGAAIADTTHISDYQEAFDLVVVNSSWAPERFQLKSLKSWLVTMSRKGATLAGIDTGAFVLGYAGLLDNYRATVHYEHFAAFKELFPMIQLENALYVVDRNRLTCSGGTASADMALRLVQKHNGLELANAAAIYLLKDRHRVGNEKQAQHDPEPVGYTMPEVLRKAVIVMERNIEEPVSVEAIAEALSTSQRQLERIFKHNTGITPVRYYINLRLDRARGLVTQTEMSVAQIASACGFGSAQQFSRAYNKHFGISPSQDRIDGRIPFQFRSFPTHLSV